MIEQPWYEYLPDWPLLILTIFSLPSSLRLTSTSSFWTFFTTSFMHSRASFTVSSTMCSPLSCWVRLKGLGPPFSQQAIISKGTPIPYTNLQLKPYPNTQLDLFCSDNFSFWYTAPNTWLTNCADPSMRLQSPTRESCWLQSSSVHTRWRSRRCLVTKPYSAQTQQLLHKNDELGKILSLVTICLNKLCLTLVQLVSPLMTLKIILLYV